MNHHPETIAEAEKAVIGSLLLKGNHMSDVAAILKPQHFVDRYYGACFESLLAQHEKLQPLCPITTMQHIRGLGLTKSEKPNPAYWIADAAVFVNAIAQPTDLHAVYYATIIASNGIRQQLAVKSEVLGRSTDDDEREKLVVDMTELTSELGRVQASKEYLTTLDVEVQTYIDRMMRHDTTLVTLGLPGIDEVIGGGVALGELIVIGARPSNGKTLVAMQVVEHMAEQGIRSLVISEEMSSQLLAERSLSHIATVDREHWRYDNDKLRAEAGIYFHNRQAIYIAESCGTVKRAVDQIQRAAAMGVRCVAIDYAQLLRGRGQTRYEQVTDISNEIKKAATKYKMIALLLCQLSRPDRSRKQHKDDNRQYARGVMWTKTDLRDSGSLEQDADVILFLTWPHADNKAYQPSDEFFINVGKNRNRGTVGNGEVRCKIDPRRQILFQPEGFQDEDEFNPDDERWT